MIGVKTEEFVLFCLHFHYLCSRPNRSATARNEEHSSCIGRSAHTDTTNLSTNSTHGRTKRNPAARRNDIPHGRSFRQPLRKKLLQQGELILSDLNFDINAGEFVYLIGRVGSGKAPYSKLYMPSFNSLKAKDTSQASTCENSNDGRFRCCDVESASSSRTINCSPTGTSS